MTTLDEIRSITEKAQVENKRRETDLQAEMSAKKRLREANAVLDAPSQFTNYILPKIKEVAAAGRNEYRYHYHSDNDVETFAVAAHARLLGFKTQFSSKSVDHGDSAAPCVVEDHHLTISWDKS